MEQNVEYRESIRNDLVVRDLYKILGSNFTAANVQKKKKKLLNTMAPNLVNMGHPKSILWSTLSIALKHN